MKKLASIFYKSETFHTRLPDEFMTDKKEPKVFQGKKYRVFGRPGFTDDRRRNVHGVVPYAPRKIIPNLRGGGVSVSEDYPQSQAHKLFPDVSEANTPRQTRGRKFDTLTQSHDEQTEFDVAVAAFNDTKDGDTIEAWIGKKNPTTKQPKNPFNPRYPYSHVRLTESGHLFEADDTPGAERIKESHRIGTYYEIGPDGSRVLKIVRDDFTVVVGNEKVNIKGSAIVTIEGDCNFYTKGNFTHQVDGDYNLLVRGKLNHRVADKVLLDYHSDCSLYVGRAITPLLGGITGRGNLGGDFNIEIVNDYKIKTGGSVSEIFGNGTAYDLFGTTVSHNSVVFGNRSTQVIGGLKYEQIELTDTKIVGGLQSLGVVGGVVENIGGARVVTIVGADTLTVGGAYLLTAGSTYSVSTTGFANITALAGLTQAVTGVYTVAVPLGTFSLTSTTTLLTSIGPTTVLGVPISLN